MFLTESGHFLLGSDLGNHNIWDSVDFSSRVLRALSLFSFRSTAADIGSADELDGWLDDKEAEL